MQTLFISDIHLHESRPEITRAFFEFLGNIGPEVNALYILGDFFDAWIGDDDDAPLNAKVAAELKALSQRGTKIFLMHGNRDFLLGDTFAAAAGAQLIADSLVIDLYGQATLLLHGDELCTNDTDYVTFRQQVRSPQWQAHILAQPLESRKILAAQLREKSQAMNSLKAEDIMDVTESEVRLVMANNKVRRLIHGHTHRPARHSLEINGEACERIVLGDWHDNAWALVATAKDIALTHWKI